MATIAGYQPCDLQSGYALPSSTAGSPSEVVAIVDAYDDPNALSDVNTYRATFGLPRLNTSGGPTFRKVDQTGGANYPGGNTSWAEEISLDLDMVSAVCPNCSILLVEAASNSLSDLGTAARYAGSAPGVVAESNSYGGSEFCYIFSCETQFDSDYNHPGVAVTVSSGDSGYGTQYPAASPYVTAVGGTTLTLDTSGQRASETVWSGAGSGCSGVEPQPSWQASVSNIVSVCSRRAVADVSADADPNTGVATYDTYGQGGWVEFGGTSVASPIVASVYALAGNTASASSYGGTSDAEWVYSHDTASSVYDVVSGSNGRCGTLLCNGHLGWDGPTGLGAPNGAGGF